MPRLSEASRQRRREIIVAAAMRCFARDGFANTSMADIISEADSSAGSVYSHFSSKAQLVRFAAESVLHDLVAAVRDELPSEHTPASVLAHLLQSSRDRAHAQTVLRIWAEVPRDPELEDVARRSLLELRELVRSALLPWCRTAHPNDPDPEAAADALADGVLTMVQGYLVRMTIDGEIDTDLLERRAVAVFESL